MSRTRTLTKRADVARALERLVLRGVPITFYELRKESGVSKSFLYEDVEIRSLVETYRARSHRKRCAEPILDTKDAIIDEQRRQIALQNAQMEELERELSGLRRDEKWRDKCTRLEQELEVMKRQLEYGTYKY